MRVYKGKETLGILFFMDQKKSKKLQNNFLVFLY